jgi:nucleotide-binding universal stress UspA family protein
MFQRILVGWDGSELAQCALSMAVDVALTYEAEVVAASVVTPSGDAHSLRAALDLACEVRGDDVEVQHEVVAGRNPAHDLLGYAHEHGFDLLIIGHHRHARPGGIMLHGMAERLLSAAALPILVVGSEGVT